MTGNGRLVNQGVSAARYSVWAGRELPGMQTSGQLKGWGRLQAQLLDKRLQVVAGNGSVRPTRKSHHCQVTASGPVGTKEWSGTSTSDPTLKKIRCRNNVWTGGYRHCRATHSRQDTGNRWTHLQSVEYRFRKPLDTPPVGYTQMAAGGFVGAGTVHQVESSVPSPRLGALGTSRGFP